MRELLTKFENALDEVESQLLAEFERIRKTLSAEPYSPIDPGVKTALNDVVIHLWKELESSGNEQKLTLRTTQHEAVSHRMIVIKKLLDARIPTAYLDAAEEQLGRTAGSGDPVTRAIKQARKPEIIIDEKKGLLGSMRDFLSKKPSEVPGGIQITDQEAGQKESVGVYNEDGVYSAAEKLAGIASHFRTTGDDREMMNAVIRGKAIFESRDLSTTLPESSREENLSGMKRTGASVFESRELSPRTADSPRQDSGLAQTPDAIRRKLEKATRRSTGSSTFGARDLANTPSPVVKTDQKKKKAEKDKTVAQTPEEIRKKLESREPNGQSGGKASFGSKDVQHAAPQEYRSKREKKKNPEPVQPIERPTGKAVFEVKDLSTNPSDQ